VVNITHHLNIVVLRNLSVAFLQRSGVGTYRELANLDIINTQVFFLQRSTKSENRQVIADEFDDVQDDKGDGERVATSSD
jgi:hypothetical protein